MVTVINGNTQRRAVLVANTETVIDFSSYVQSLSIKADGGKVYFKTNKTLTDNTDLAANYIVDGESFDLYEDSKVAELHCYTTDTNVTLQWYMP